MSASSSKAIPAMRPCAKCQGKDLECSLCKGQGFVTISVNTAWLLEQGKALDLEDLDDTLPGT